MNLRGVSLTVIDEYLEAFGRRPSSLCVSGFNPTESSVRKLLSSRDDPVAGNGAKEPTASEMWPLLSHHHYGQRSLFGLNDAGQLTQRTLSLLLMYDGIVAANPLEDVAQLVQADRTDEAIRLLRTVTREIASIEPLIEAGTLRLTSLRPNLANDDRSRVLELLGIDADLQVFTNFIEAAGTIEDLPESLHGSFLDETSELFELWEGLEAPKIDNLADAVAAVIDLAAAVIEVSWQVAVTTQDSACDLAVQGPVERQLLEILINRASVMGGDPTLEPFVQGVQRRDRLTSQFERIAIGNVPNLDSTRLIIPDALAIRKDDTFSVFRQALREAIEAYDRNLKAGEMAHRARAQFEAAMSEASQTLGRKVGKASFRGLMSDGMVQTGIGVLSAPVVAMAGTGLSAATAITGGFSALGLVGGSTWKWLKGRRTPGSTEAAVRYCALLAPPTPTPTIGRARR